MTSTDNIGHIVSKTSVIRWFAMVFLLCTTTFAFATPLNSDNIKGRSFNGVTADNARVQCYFNLGSIKRSPANKFFRKAKFGINRVTWSFLDLDPKRKIPLVHYNQKGWYGYDIWFRSYGTDNPYARVWMNYMVSKTVPAAVQLYSVGKKTNVNRLLGECTNLR